jgi:hypothetical protein
MNSGESTLPNQGVFLLEPYYLSLKKRFLRVACFGSFIRVYLPSCKSLESLTFFSHNAPLSSLKDKVIKGTVLSRPWAIYSRSQAEGIGRENEKKARKKNV